MSTAPHMPSTAQLERMPSSQSAQRAKGKTTPKPRIPPPAVPPADADSRRMRRDAAAMTYFLLDACKETANFGALEQTFPNNILRNFAPTNRADRVEYGKKI